jgi:predicted nucleic acid-binding protein
VITYVDTSTLIKLVVDEPGSEHAAEIWRASDSLLSVSLVIVEARAALAAARRGGRITAAGHKRATTIVTDLIEQLDIISIDNELVEAAADLAEREALRAYDAVHLAAALRVQVDAMTSADEALNAAAARQNLNIANPTDRR